MVCLEKTPQIVSRQIQASPLVFTSSLLTVTFPSNRSWPMISHHLMLWCQDGFAQIVALPDNLCLCCLWKTQSLWGSQSCILEACFHFGCKSFFLFPIPQHAAWASAVGLYHFKLSISIMISSARTILFSFFSPWDSSQALAVIITAVDIAIVKVDRCSCAVLFSRPTSILNF